MHAVCLPTAIRRYVDYVPAERAFREAIGTQIVADGETMGAPTFTLDGTHFTGYAKDFIRQVAPKVADNAPSVLLKSNGLPALHPLISEHTQQVSGINQAPVENYNFASPSGLHFAVRSARAGSTNRCSGLRSSS